MLQKGLLAGLWEFPNELVVESEKRYGDNTADGIAGFLEPLSGVRLHQTGKTKPAKHIFSHVEWHMEGIRLEVQTAEETGWWKSASDTPGTEAKENPAGGQGNSSDWAFATPQELQEKYPIPSAFETFVREILTDAEK